MAGMIQVPYGLHGQFVTRPAPLMPAQAYKTYGMSMPVQSHWRPATCEEIMCFNYLNGWKTVVAEGSPHADIARSLRGSYSFTETAQPGGMVEFVFAPGQKCFKWNDHRVQLERPARYYVADGDFRGNPRRTPVRVHQRAEDWVSDFGEHQMKLAEAVQRG
jgi:hypothetical protein